jgi:imidazoleglycerol phosphate synthase glutamine amidotransferase subunit HisH
VVRAARDLGAPGRDPVYGVQFHPEKSSTHGLALLGNFTAICARTPV